MPSDCAEELIKADHAIAISIEMLENVESLFFCKSNADVSQAPVEFRLINLTVAVVIKVFEYSCKATNAKRASVLQLFFHFSDEILSSVFYFLDWLGK